MIVERLPVRKCVAFVLGLLALLPACGNGEVPETPSKTSVGPALKLHVFDCGTIPVHDLELFSLSIEEVAVATVVGLWRGSHVGE